ncbi:MAG: hypothetical protein R3351_05975 [Nitrospirales bacterium]|nr:hypothetical protein [Nitrospirales bacterium]
MDRKEKLEEGPGEENSPLILKAHTYADMRQIAKKNLEEAKRVLAESGCQLFQNSKGDSDLRGQNPEETYSDSKDEK